MPRLLQGLQHYCSKRASNLFLVSNVGTFTISHWYTTIQLEQCYKCEICEREFTQGLWNKHYVVQHWQRENIKENNNTKGLPLVGSHHHCLKCLQLHTLTKWINQTFLSTLFWGLGTSFRNFIWSPWMGHC